jgi:succinate dehydrogenase / fumarate reductase iron-sulfur subunit
MKQNITLRIRRQNGWAEYAVEIPSEAYVLDALEAAQRQDKTLLFRHSCHHASCGSCGMRVNGKERLACITMISEIRRPGNLVVLEPLRNFPIIADLVIDPEHFLSQLDAVDMPPVGMENPENELKGPPKYSHFENCIECGLCFSACPVVGSDKYYLGPAALAAARRVLDGQTGKEASPVWELIDDDHGIWRCHGVFECTQVCPAGVDPAGGIMTLRQRLLRGRR